MLADTYVEHLRRELSAFEAELDGDLNASVPGCPGWNVETLVSHVGQVHRSALLNLHAGPGAELNLDRGPAPTDVDTLIPWYLEGAERLVTTLEATDPDEHRPNWAGAPTSLWYFRRMAQVMGVHRWDIQSAHGHAEPIDATLAADGIDEVGELFTGRIDPAALGGNRTIHLHATDEGLGDAGEWVFTLGDDEITFVHAHDKGDVAARATASDLLLMLWNRVARGATETFGDEALLDRFLDELSGI
ncbi:MAG TPA: maleylpyruvate isomerase family mycothiol-dependent enzyme [Acidimicrobiales bacterium]|nr:maleylpyruvate isomerase family mycothiol-dependent enzyme [Acidimicrobiales bacterium]